MRLVITGGGTGGHTSPAVAVYEELLRRDPRLAVLWIGRHGAIEHRICGKLGIPFRSLPVEGWPRRKTIRRATVAAKIAWSMARVWMHLRNFGPDIVFGVGGYVSLPAMYMAPRMKIPTVLHEQNRLMGVTNRIASQRATRIFLSFPETIGAPTDSRIAVVGNPVRSAFASPPSRAQACAQFGLAENLPVVLICGGSQGARSINDAVAAALPHLRPDEMQLVWMTGANDAQRARQAAQSAQCHVQVHSFIDNMAAACAAADLVVTRSGASTTAELALMHKPSILVPYPHATDNHQEHNARAFLDAGAALMINDAEFSADQFAQSVRGLLVDTGRLVRMSESAARLAKPGAAESIAADIINLVYR